MAEVEEIRIDPRFVGRLLADIELQLDQEIPEELQVLLKRVAKHLRVTISKEAEGWQRSCWISRLVTKIEKAETTDQVTELILEADQLKLLTVLSPSEARENRQDRTKKFLLVYLPDQVWAPIDFRDGGQRLLCKTLCRKLRELRSRKEGGKKLIQQAFEEAQNAKDQDAQKD